MLQNKEKKTDRRTLYTRKVIREALFDLLNEKHPDKITVKEICEKADINRATFYRNYMDIYDLYEQLEEELTSSAFSDGNIENDRHKLLEIIYENQAFYREFFESRMESRYIKKVIGVIKEWLSSGCPEKPREFGDIIYGIVEKQYQQ
ncbi:MAG: TetR-like C-terminal domain-containing protein [Eubacteriales bacterium]|nr:TetR-like C-terminal domain-containing protein [Eubacteriales bacterium]